MTKWILLLSVPIAGIILWYVFQRIGENVSVAIPPAQNAITVFHAFKDGVHRYAGELRLPHSCYAQLTPEILVNPKAPTALVLSLVTKDQLLDQRLCFQIPTNYPFETVTDAPEGATISLRVNGVDLPITLIETAWQDPRGTILNLENKPK